MEMITSHWRRQRKLQILDPDLSGWNGHMCINKIITLGLCHLNKSGDFENYVTRLTIMGGSVSDELERSDIIVWYDDDFLNKESINL